MPRPRPYLAFVLLIAALLSPACGNDTPPPPAAPTPAEITEPFDGTINVNGAAIHPFVVQRAGQVTAKFSILDPDSTVTLGLSLGTWNGLVCDIRIASTSATLNTTITGTASTTGNFCAYINDVGKLTAPTSYQIIVTHF